MFAVKPVDLSNKIWLICCLFIHFYSLGNRRNKSVISNRRSVRAKVREEGTCISYMKECKISIGHIENIESFSHWKSDNTL